MNLEVGAAGQMKGACPVTALLPVALCEVAATTQVCSAVWDSVVSRADLSQNITLWKKKTKDLIYTEG